MNTRHIVERMKKEEEKIMEGILTDGMPLPVHGPKPMLRQNRFKIITKPTVSVEKKLEKLPKEEISSTCCCTM